MVEHFQVSRISPRLILMRAFHGDVSSVQYSMDQEEATQALALDRRLP
jgi:hypothetical protein